MRIKKAAAAIILAAAIAASSAFFVSDALYNDKTFESYTNLSENSNIPSLFRNDSVFSLYKEHPPVISDGIEYVPLELFYGLSGVKISFSDDGSNFYIQNKNTNKYISFSINGNYAVTGENKVYETEVKSYYDVHYVPLRVVCSVTGIGCDSYNDGINKIYVIKVFTADGLSAQELIKIHAPGIYDTASREENPPVVPPQPDNPDGERTDTQNPDSEKTEIPFGRRNLMLFFCGGNFENAGKTLDSLSANGAKAVFFVTESDILNNPDTVRRIYTEGHTIGITFNESAEELCAEGGIEKLAESAENALYEVLKTKTRIITLPEDNGALYGKSDIYGRIAALGLRNVTFNIDSRTDVLSTASASANVTEGIRNLEAVRRTQTAFIKLSHTNSGRSVLASIVSLVHKNRPLTLTLFDEATN